MKYHTGKNKMEVFAWITIWIFLVVSAMMSTSVAAITWTKYQFEGMATEVECIPKETRFVTEVLDPFVCSKICYEDEECLSVFFHPEYHQCIGCQQEFQNNVGMTAATGFVHYSKRKLKIDCKEIKDKNHSAESGVYHIMLSSSETLQVYCDMETDGGGWTVFQNRFDGSIDFSRNFSDYENGFGDINGEFWLGLKFIQQLTEMPSEVHYFINASIDGPGYEKYGGFKLLGPRYTLSIDDEPVEREDFTVHLTLFNGDDFWTIDHNSYDCENIPFEGGWWYSELFSCDRWLNPNGVYGEPISSPSYDVETKRVIKTLKLMLRRTEQ